MENIQTFTVVTDDGPKKVQIIQRPLSNAQDESFFVRPETDDFRIFEDVVQHNEYGLPAHLAKHDVVIDIGAHIGSFTYAALIRGADRVYAYEAHPINYVIAFKNLERFGDRAICRELAVWRSDSAGQTLFNDPLGNYDHNHNTGGYSVVFNNDGLAVQAIGLDEILFEASHGLSRPIRLLKIDCEGAEYPILFTAKYLSIIKEICGEYHDIPSDIVPPRAKVEGVEKFNCHSLKKFLETQGFSVELNSKGPTLGIFHARRKIESPFPFRHIVNFSNHVKAQLFRTRKQEMPQAEVELNRFTEWKAAESGLGSSRDWDAATERDIYYCYRLLLNREPDLGGWVNWTSRIRSKMSLQELVALFMDSEEFRNRSRRE